MPRVFRILRSRHVIEPEITAEEFPSKKSVCSQNKRKHEKDYKDQKEAETPKCSEKESTGQRKDESEGKQSSAQPVDHTKPTEPPADQEFWEKRGSHFVCKKCDKEFKMLYILRRHLPIHTGERRFKCNQCGCTFKQSSTLSRHLDLHKNTRRFSCDTCGAAFNRASTLMQHKKTHSKEKQFACPHCDKKFHQKGNLKSHIFTHTGEKPHECPVCHQRFNQQSNLALHMSSRHTDKPAHNCSLCGQMFIRKKFLRNHEVQDHGLKLPVYVTRQLDTPLPTKQTNVVKTVPKCVRQQVRHSAKAYGTNTVSLKNGDKTIRFPGYEFKNGSQEQVKMGKNDTEMQNMATKHTGTGESATKTTDVTQTTKSTVPVTSAVLSGVTLLSELAAAQTNKNTSQSSTDDVPKSGLVSQSGTNVPQTGTSASQSCAEVALSGAHVTQSVMNVLQDSSNSTKESTAMPVITVLGRDSNNKLVVEVKMPNQQPRFAHLLSAIPETQPRTLQISSMHGKQTMNPPKSVLTGGTINTTGCTINTTGGTINTTGGTVNPIGGTINTTGCTINTSVNKTSLPSAGGIAKTIESHSLTVMPSEPSTTCTTTKSCSQLAPHHTDSENTSKNDTGSRDSNHKGTPILDSFLNIVRRPNVAKESQSGITEKSPSGTNTQLGETEKYNELLKTDLFPTALFSNIKPVTNNNITLTSTPCIGGATQQENPVINLVSGVCTSVPVHPMANLNTQNNSRGQGVPQGQMAFRNEEVLQNQIVLPSAVLMPGNGATNTAVPSLQPVPVGTTIESSTTVATSFGFNNRGSKRTTIRGDRVPSILPKRNKSQIERSSFLPSSVASQVRSSMTHHRLKSGGEVSINHEASGPCTLDEGREKDDDKSNSRVELDNKSSEKSSQSLDDVLSQYAKFALTPSPIAPKPAQQRKNPELAQLQLSQPKITVGSNAVLTTPVVQLGTAVSHTLPSSGILGPLQTQQPSVLQPTALPYILIPANINPTPTAIVNSTQTAFVTPQQTGFVNPVPTSTIYPTSAATVNPTSAATVNPTPTATVYPRPTATVNPPPTVILNPSATSTVNPTQIVLSLVPNVKETAPMQCPHNKDLDASLNKIQPTQKSVQLNTNPNELQFADVGETLKFTQHKLSGKSAPTFTPNVATTTPPTSDAGAKTSASLAASDSNPVLSTSWSSDSKILALLNQLDSSTSSFTSSLDLRETTLVPSSAEQKQLQKQTTKVLDADDSYITGSPQIDLDEGSNLSFLDMDYSNA